MVVMYALGSKRLNSVVSQRLVGDLTLRKVPSASVRLLSFLHLTGEKAEEKVRLTLQGGAQGHGRLRNRCCPWRPLKAMWMDSPLKRVVTPCTKGL